MKNDKRILCYYILSYVSGLTGFNISKMTNDDVMKVVKKLEQYSNDDLLSMYEFLDTMFIVKNKLDKEEK